MPNEAPAMSDAEEEKNPSENVENLLPHLEGEAKSQVSQLEFKEGQLQKRRDEIITQIREMGDDPITGMYSKKRRDQEELKKLNDLKQVFEEINMKIESHHLAIATMEGGEKNQKEAVQELHDQVESFDEKIDKLKGYLERDDVIFKNAEKTGVQVRMPDMREQYKEELSTLNTHKEKLQQAQKVLEEMPHMK